MTDRNVERLVYNFTNIHDTTCKNEGSGHLARHASWGLTTGESLPTPDCHCMPMS